MKNTSTLIVDRETEPDRKPVLHDCATFRNHNKTVAGQYITGFIAEVRGDTLRMHYGSWYNVKDCVKFIPRDGRAIPSDTSGLPVNHL